MKKFILASFLFIGSFAAQAQEGLTWHTNIDEAITVSKVENKPLFLFFTGSDWCGWCIRLQKEVFKTPEFEAWAKEKVVLVELDFPRKNTQTDAIKMQNNLLQQFFQIKGYPSVRIAKPGIAADGKTSFELLGEVSYGAGGPNVWLKGPEQIVAKFIPFTEEEQKAAKKATKKKKSTKKKA
jgi:protein disulfide-isomerase